MDDDKATPEQIAAIKAAAVERADYLRWLALRLEGFDSLIRTAAQELRQLAEGK